MDIDIVIHSKIRNYTKGRVRELVLGYPLIILTLFFLAPMVYLGATSFYPSPSGEFYHFGFTFNNYLQLFKSDLYINRIWTTLQVAAVTTGLCIVIGYPLAYGIAHMESSVYRRIYLTAIITTTWLTVIIRAYSIQVLLTQNGVLNTALVRFGLASEPLFSGTGWVALFSGMVYGFLPFAILTIYSSIINIDIEIKEASSNLGANRLQTFWNITLPLSRNGVLAAGILVFVLSMGNYAIPALLGQSDQWTLPVVITQQVIELLNVPFAAVLSIVILFIVGLLFLFVIRILNLGTRDLAGSDSAGSDSVDNDFNEGRSLSQGRIGRWFSTTLGIIPDRLNEKGPTIVNIYIGVMFVIMVIPVIIILAISLTASEFVAFPPEGISLRWFKLALSSGSWQSSILNSLVIATAASIFSMTIGLPLAFAFDRYEIPFERTLQGVSVLPLLLPPIIMGIGFLALFIQIGVWGTIIGVIIAHGVVFSPFSFVLVSSGLDEIDDSLDEVAQILGATPWKSFRSIIAPLLVTNVFAAMLFSFILSLNEYLIAYLVSGFAISTVPIKIFSSLRYSYSPVIAAISVLYIIFTTVVMLVLEYRLGGALWE